MTDLVRKAAGEKEISCCFKERAKDANKGDFGYIALLGGSLPYSGAVRLAAMAGCAVRAGAGVVTAAVPGSIAYMVAEKVLEATVYPLSDEDGYIKFSEEELTAFAESCRANVWPQLAKNYPEGWLEKIEESLK